MSIGTQIKSLRKYASKLPEYDKNHYCEIHWVCNELERVQSGKLNEKEALAFVQHILPSIKNNTEAIIDLQNQVNELKHDRDMYGS